MTFVATSWERSGTEAIDQRQPRLTSAIRFWDRHRRRFLWLFGVVVMLGMTGCSGGVFRKPDPVWLRAPKQPIPSSHLPVSRRLKNWSGRSVRGGSCVHCSSINAFRSMNAPEWEAVWVTNRSRGYEGGETANGILSKYKDQNLPYIATKSADMRLWDLASQTRRAGIWWYYPSHCVTNFGTFDIPDRDGRRRPSVLMLDNNRTESYIAVDREIARDAWRYYGGFGAIPWLTPAIPYTFNGLVDPS
ncbi:MAG: hypothetical protein AAF539_06200 [Planctomycetota bacterium]